MISWTIATTGIETTSYFSSHTLVTATLSRTVNSSTTSINFFGDVTYSTTSSESGSGLTSRATIRSANETATFSTLLISLEGAYNSQSGGSELYTDSSLNFTNSDQYQPPTSSETYPKVTTSSGLRTYFTTHQQTSTIQTTSAIRFGSIQSGLATPAGAVAARVDFGITATTIGESEYTTLTTTQAPTYWFFTSASTVSSFDTTTTISQTTSGVSRATVYQAAANEVLFAISNPTSYQDAATPARPIGATYERLTVLPARTTESRSGVTGSISLSAQISPPVNTSDATSSRVVAIQTELSRDITQYGPDNESTVTQHVYLASTTETQSIPANYTYTQIWSELGDSTNATLSETQGIYNETQIALEANRYIDTNWIAELSQGQPAGTSQARYGKAYWNIAGQKGSELTPTALSTLFSTASISRGQVTIVDVTNQNITVAIPSITYKTNNGTEATTSSTIFSVEGTPQLVGDDVTQPDHLGGGEFAESWTVIDRVQPDYVYSDLKNSQSVSYLGDDTSHSQGESVSASYLTFEPYLLGGQPEASPVDAIVWTEFRNPTAYPA